MSATKLDLIGLNRSIQPLTATRQAAAPWTIADRTDKAFVLGLATYCCPAQPALQRQPKIVCDVRVDSGILGEGERI